MSNLIYGINPDKEVTCLMVREALVECFYEAHCSDADIGPVDESTNRAYCREVVEKAFKSVGGNLENPSRNDLVAVMDYLASFSKNFRSDPLIQKHYGEIAMLLGKVK